ncbi:MAG: hypothetical protein RIQ28_410, partial [Pseudomonadota bacterium]
MKMKWLLGAALAMTITAPVRADALREAIAKDMPSVMVIYLVFNAFTEVFFVLFLMV